MNEEQLNFAKALLEYYAVNGIPKNNPRTYEDLYHLHETATCSKLMLKAVKDDLYSHLRRNTAPPWIAANSEYSYIFKRLRMQITPESSDPCQTVINFLKDVLNYYEECKRVPFTTEERAGMVKHLYPKSEMYRKQMRSALSKLHRQLNNGKRSGWMFDEMLEQVNRVAAMNFEQNGHLLQIRQEEEEVKKSVKRKRRVETSGDSDSDYAPPISFWHRERAIEGEMKAATSKADIEDFEEENKADIDYTPEEPFVSRNLEDTEIKELRRLVAKRENLFQRQFIYHQENINRLGEKLKKKIKKIREVQFRLEEADYIDAEETYRTQQEVINALEAKLKEMKGIKLEERGDFSLQNGHSSATSCLSIESDFNQKLVEKEQEINCLRALLSSSISIEEVQRLNEELSLTKDILEQKETQLKVLQDQHETSVLEAIKTAQIREELVQLKKSLEEMKRSELINNNNLSLPADIDALKHLLEERDNQLRQKDQTIKELQFIAESAHAIEFEKLKAEVQRLKREIVEDNEELRCNDSEIEELNLRVKRAEEISSTLPKLEEKLRRTEEDLQQKEQNSRELELDLIIVKDDKNSLLEQMNKLQKELEEKSAALSEKEKYLMVLQIQKEADQEILKREAEKLRKDLQENEQKLQLKENIIDVLLVEKEALEKEQNELAGCQKASKLIANLAKKEKVLKQMEESLQSKTQSLLKAEETIKKLQEDTVNMTKELKEKDHQLKEIEKARSELQKSLEETSKMLQREQEKANKMGVISYEQLTKQLQEKEKEIHVKATVIKELKRVNEQLKSAAPSSQRESKELINLRKLLAEQENKLEEFKDQKKKDKESIQNLNDQICGLLTAVDEKEKEMEELKKFKKKAMKETARSIRLAEEKAKFKERIDELEAKGITKEKEGKKVSDLERQLKEAKDANVSQAKEIEAIAKQNSEKLTEEINSLQKKISAMARDLKERDESLFKLQLDLDKLCLDLKEKEKSLLAKEEVLKSCQIALEKKETEELKNNEEIAQLQALLKAKEKSIEELDKAKRDEKSSQNILQSRIKEQETLLNKKTNDVSHLKKLLAEKDFEVAEERKLKTSIQTILQTNLQENQKLKEQLKEKELEKIVMNRDLIGQIGKIKQHEMERIHLIQSQGQIPELENYRRQLAQKENIISDMKTALKQLEEALNTTRRILKENDEKQCKIMENSAREILQQSLIHNNEKLRLEEELRVTRRLLAVKETQLQERRGAVDGAVNEADGQDPSMQMYLQYYNPNQVENDFQQMPAFYILQQEVMGQENLQYVVYPQQGPSTDQPYQVTLPDGRIGQVVGNFQLNPQENPEEPAQQELPCVEQKFSIINKDAPEPAEQEEATNSAQQEGADGTILPGTSFDFSQPGPSSVYNFPSRRSNYPSIPTPAMINGVAHHRPPLSMNGTVPVPNYSSLQKEFMKNISKSTEKTMPPPAIVKRGRGRPRKHLKPADDGLPKIPQRRQQPKENNKKQ